MGTRTVDDLEIIRNPFPGKVVDEVKVTYKLDTPLTPHGEAMKLQQEATSGDDIVPQYVLSSEGSPREQLLAIAAGAVLKQRNHTYGKPEDAFGRVAALWSALNPEHAPYGKHQVALMIAMVKVARLMENPTHKDSWADLAGYAACGYEAAVGEYNDEQTGE